jgi:hypothetical protein
MMLCGVRRRSAWLIVVPLMVAGTEAAHALAYRIVYPQAAVRMQVLAASGHGYAAWLTLGMGVGGAIGLIGFACGAADAARRQTPRPVPAWAFGLLPLVGFTLQELTERWLAVGGFPWWMVEQPTFRVGLLLQLPFAVVAYGVALLLLRAARRIGFALSAERRFVVFPALARRRPPLDVAVAVPSGLAGGHAGRGPPALACAPLLCR